MKVDLFSTQRAKFRICRSLESVEIRRIIVLGWSSDARSMEGLGLKASGGRNHGAGAGGGVKCSSGGCNHNDASLFPCRCAGQHGEVQRPGRVQLQHANAVRAREGAVHRRAGGALRPGPQRHQQTAATAGETHNSALAAASADSQSERTSRGEEPKRSSAISSPPPDC